ncbi:uncharacterized protein LOC142332635 isoform X2 [Lycorma delicatula]|uniref:uncharacterized protein LOC142332635 isoform X2 n=1 Tax=Lycorma delicatula TaxID=130591 RepID=UPI003F514586
MEVPDVNVRVLYDFEYTTKDGRQIKIKSGERLFLINKTNSDWWHVIRSSERRPFYVPATYVQEIRKSEGSTNSKENKFNSKVERQASADAVDEGEKQHQSLINVREDPVGFSMGYRNRSCSLEEKKMYSVKLSSVDRQRILSKGKFPIAQFKAYPEVVEEPEPKSIHDEEVDYVNLRKEGDGFVIDEENTGEVIKDSVKTYDDEVAAEKVEVIKTNDHEKLDGVDLLKPDVITDSGSGYSFVSGLCKNEVKKSESTSSLPVLSNIPHSSSLEELALEIQLKTYSLRSTIASVAANEDTKIQPLTNLSSDNKVPSTSNNSFESVLDSAIGCSDSSKEENKSKIDINLPSSPVPLPRKLHYVGSFKTKQERQKWAKQHFSPSELVSDPVDLSGDIKRKVAADEITCMEIEEPKHVKVEEKLTKSLDCGDRLQLQKIETDSKNIVSIAVNYESVSQSLNEKDKSSSFLESSRKTEEHLQQIHQNLGIAQEASAKMENLVALNAKHKRTFTFISEECPPDSADGHEGSKDNKTSIRIPFLQPKTTSLKDSTESIRGTSSTNSERGSTDSLLDIDKNSNSRKISCGTTTSESFIQTDGEDLDEGNSESETDSVVLGLNRIKMSKSQDGYKKKIPLTRNRRVDSHKTRYVQQAAPPSPAPLQTPTRVVMGDWNEYMTDDGRIFYYNTHTSEKSWKPPRLRSNSNEDKNDGSLSNVYSGSSSPLAEVDEKLIQSGLENLPLPAGWKTKLDEETGLACYINLVTGAKWFSSSDNEGRVYFFEENSNESSWSLPETNFVTNINESVSMGAQTTEKTTERNSNRVTKTRSMIFDDRREDTPAPQLIPRNWPQLRDGHMCVLKEGPLNRTKITENGKRLRKSWASSYVVLTELQLLFFKDIKTFTAMKTGDFRPEMSIDLNGSLIDKRDKVSSRKNVFVISTVFGLEVLIQCDCPIQAEEWLRSIQSAIKNLPSAIDSSNKVTKSSKDHPKQEDLLDDNKKVSRIGRSKSVKHEPAFGCYLEQVCGKEHPRVPVFVQHCIECIERTEENMKTDGLYRASGNLSQVQKIRLHVDQNKLSILDQEEDVHVLTGALKLFFRELKQPLIPFQLFSKALKASTHHNRKEKLSQFRDIIKNLPVPNHDTLKFLLQHLLRVTKYQEFNRMHIPNLAIVFGPTLMWPEQESQNMALDLMQQNLVIECFLVEFDYIFR